MPDENQKCVDCPYLKIEKNKPQCTYVDEILGTIGCLTCMGLKSLNDTCLVHKLRKKLE